MNMCTLEIEPLYSVTKGHTGDWTVGMLRENRSYIA